MANTTTATGATPAPKHLTQRFIGIITAPAETYRSIVAHPRWLGMLLLTAIGISVLATAPMMTEAGREAAIEQQVRQTEAWTGQPVDDAAYERMRQMSGIMPYFSAGGAFVMVPLMTLITAGILFAIFNAAMGGNATFKQVFAVTVHANVISVLAQMFTAPINIARGGMGSLTSLGAAFPFLDESSFLARLLGMVDLFMIWYVFVLAIGLAVLYRRKTQPIAITLFGVYAAIIVVIAAVMGSFGGGN